MEVTGCDVVVTGVLRPPTRCMYCDVEATGCDVVMTGALRPPTRCRYCDLAVSNTDWQLLVFDAAAMTFGISDLINVEVTAAAVATDDRAEVVLNLPTLLLVLLTAGVSDSTVVTVCL